jgi:hypothetical protein
MAQGIKVKIKDLLISKMESDGQQNASKLFEDMPQQMPGQVPGVPPQGPQAPQMPQMPQQATPMPQMPNLTPAV